MQHKVADKLVYCHETIHLQHKLQDAGWKAEVVAHESDRQTRTTRLPLTRRRDMSEEIFSEETVLLLMQYRPYSCNSRGEFTLTHNVISKGLLPYAFCLLQDIQDDYACQ